MQTPRVDELAEETVTRMFAIEGHPKDVSGAIIKLIASTLLKYREEVIAEVRRKVECRCDSYCLKETLKAIDTLAASVKGKE